MHQSYVLTPLSTHCVIAAEPDRTLMLPERAGSPVVLAAATPYGTVLVRYHSPIVYLLENGRYMVGDFIESIGIENKNIVIVWEGSDAKRKGVKALEAEIENINAELTRIQPAVAG